MARNIYDGTARDGHGHIISNALVTVMLAGTSTFASVYTALAGGVAVNSVYSSTDGVFTFYVDHDDYSSDQLFKISISKSGYTTKVYDYIAIFPRSDRVIYPEDFGASPSASAATNVAAFQAAIDSITATIYRPAALNYDGAVPYIRVSSGKYQFNDKLTISEYTKIVADGQVIFEGTDVTKDIIYSQHPYHNEFRGITFVGGKSHINLMNGTDLVAGVDGLEGVFTKIRDCYFALSADYAVKLARNATNGGWHAVIKDSEAFHNSQFLYASSIDTVTIDDVYLEPDKSFTADDLAQIVNAGYTNMAVRRLTGASSSFVANTTNRWFDNYFVLSIKESRFGSESGGGQPLVYNFTDCLAHAVYPFLEGSSITVKDCLAYCSGAGGADRGVIVLKSGLPNSIIVENVTGDYDGTTAWIINTQAMTGAVTLATYLATGDPAYTPILNISLKNNPAWPGTAPLISLALDASSDEDRLRPWMETTLTTYGTGGNISKIQNQSIINLDSLVKLYGKVYAQTSISPAAPNDTISIVDTGITVSATTEYGAYLLSITGNPNHGGSANYTETAVGVISLNTTIGPIVNIAYTPILAAATLTVTPTISAGQIRVSIGAYAAGHAGDYQIVRIVRLI